MLIHAVHSCVQGWERTAIENAHLFLHGLQPVAAKRQQHGAALVTCQQLFERHLARLDAPHQLLQFFQRSFVAGRVGILGLGMGRRERKAKRAILGRYRGLHACVQPFVSCRSSPSDQYTHGGCGNGATQ